MVHNTQKHYRELVDLFSRPGEIRISTFDTPNFTGFSDAVLATVLTLFDNEIAFYANDKKDCDELQTLTGGQCHGDLAEIDYAVVKADELTEGLFENVKAGTLASPENSATLIIEVVSIGEGHRYALKGPGIKAENILEMTLDPKWMKMRTERCKEFPLGIDLILIDRHNQMTVTPRTILAEVM
ncbi:phosphonate C-P lyase system protein PhnH [Salinicoccus sp. HZC-1]|uniref:phosphonate C-P lyase system protein PhnH n=1 Tax=Salinicoccus sp. HZC-1 TaxID=3385497 RepID=UPI00398AEA18